MRRIPMILCLAAASVALVACRQQAPTTAGEVPAAVQPAGGDSSASVQPTAEAMAPTSAPQDSAPSSNVPAAGSDAGASGNPGVRTFVIQPDASAVRYKVGEVFFREGNRFNLAVGTTGVVEGAVKIDTANPANSTISPITVDISSFKSDSDRRDNALRNRFLESAKFPKAVFTPTKIDGVPADAKEGQELHLTVVGDLTVRETTKPATFLVTATLQGNTLTGLASGEFNMSDHGVPIPDIAGMLKAEDKTQIEFEFVAKEQ